MRAGSDWSTLSVTVASARDHGLAFAFEPAGATPLANERSDAHRYPGAALIGRRKRALTAHSDMAPNMEPLVILVFLPFAIGLVCEWVFRDRKRAMFTAAACTTLALFLTLRLLDSEGTWNWLAALLVSPLAITFALFAVIVTYGRSQTPRRRHRRQDA